MRASCPASLILLDLISLTIFGEAFYRHTHTRVTFKRHYDEWLGLATIHWPCFHGPGLYIDELAGFFYEWEIVSSGE